MKNNKNLAENIAYSIVAWLQTLGSTRFQLTVLTIVFVILYGEKTDHLLSATQWTQICILVVTWLLGESIRPHASIKNNNEVVKNNNEIPKSDNEIVLEDAISKLNSISGASSPIGPLLKACIDVLETARQVLIKFRRF